MGMFGSRDTEWEEIKEEYRSAKMEIVDAEQQIQMVLDASSVVITEKFQYLIREDIEQAELSRLGLDGWDLVNFASYTVGWGVNGNAAMKVHLRYVFKRLAADVGPEGKVWMERLATLQARKAELASIIEMRGYKAE